MSELLAADRGVRISGKSIVRVLREKGILDPFSWYHRRRRESRDRAPKEGLLVQVDASSHKWLEERDPALGLHGAIDDATSKVLALYFRPTEDLKGYFETLRQVIARHGIPRTLYSDGHTIFFPTEAGQLTIEEALDGPSLIHQTTPNSSALSAPCQCGRFTDKQRERQQHPAVPPRIVAEEDGFGEGRW